MNGPASVWGTRLIERADGAPALSLRRAKLVVVDGQDRGLEASLGVVALTLGTAAECGLVFHDDAVSSRHAEISHGTNGIRLRDLGSRNGTFVEGMRVHDVELDRSVELVIGATRVRLVLEAGEDEVPLARATSFGGLLGHGPAMRAAFAVLERAAKTESTVLLLGESGTGKELAARALHDRSARGSGPYVVFDCAAAAPTLVESQLFGHVRGAYTGALDTRSGVFEEANGGTLVLDEVGELPLELQPKLLRALESRSVQRLGDTKRRDVDVRFVACTNRNLEAEVKAGRFRADLFYRLSVLEVRLPPLRERPEEIPRLVRHFAQTLAGDEAPTIPPELMVLFVRHAWPGNVRELRNVVERFIALRHVDVATLGGDAPRDETRPAPIPRSLLDRPFHDAKATVTDDFERAYLEALLATHGKNLSEAARVSGLSRQSCYRLLHKHGLRSDDEG